MDLIEELKNKHIDIFLIRKKYTSSALAKELALLMKKKTTIELLERNSIFLKNFTHLVSFLYLIEHSNKIDRTINSVPRKISSNLFDKNFLNKLYGLDDPAAIYN